MIRRKRFRDEVNFKALGAEFGTKVTDEVRHVMEDMANQMVEEMKSLVPVKTGDLRDSIHWKWGKGKTIIIFLADAKDPKDGVAYGKLVEFDPRIMEPFMYPVLDANKEEWKRRIIEAVRKAAQDVGHS
jgi:hypothetical protein